MPLSSPVPAASFYSLSSPRCCSWVHPGALPRCVAPRVFPCVRLVTAYCVFWGCFEQWGHVNPKVGLLSAGVGCCLEGFLSAWLVGFNLRAR